MRFNRGRARYPGLLFLGPLLAGCQLAGTKETREQADQNWNRMRAGVKLQLAQQHADRQLFDEALAGATEALALDPAQPAAYALAAKAHLELGRLASAERVLEAARRLKVGSPELTYLAGVVAEQRGQIDAAFGYFREARQSGGRVDYLIAEAECLVALDRADQALPLLEAHQDSFDDHATVSTAAGRVAVLLGESDKAVAFYREAYARQPDSRSVRRELGVLLAQTGRCGEAVPLLRGLADEADPEPAGSVYRSLAACHLAADDPAAAANVLSGYLATRAEDPAAQLLFAQAAIATRDYLAVTRSLFLAETHGAPRAQVMFLRGVAAWRQGNLPDAAAFLEQVLSIDPADVDASCLLGEVQAALGNDEFAAEAFSRALHLSPANQWAQERLEVITKYK